ncbi:MAG: hypothetical protein P4L58_00575, partial [Candidatus Pacebacteria bacterium]|nr:hypothetical protein [Candidatus Paceibacterota bacterium]
IEYIISRQEEIIQFINLIEPYIKLKKAQLELLKKIIDLKKKVQDKKDFIKLINLIDKFRELNYSKKRKKRTLTP